MNTKLLWLQIYDVIGVEVLYVMLCQFLNDIANRFFSTETSDFLKTNDCSQVIKFHVTW